MVVIYDVYLGHPLKFIWSECSRSSPYTSALMRSSVTSIASSLTTTRTYTASPHYLVDRSRVAWTSTRNADDCRTYSAVGLRLVATDGHAAGMAQVSSVVSWP